MSGFRPIKTVISSEFTVKKLIILIFLKYLNYLTVSVEVNKIIRNVNANKNE